MLGPGRWEARNQWRWHTLRAATHAATDRLGRSSGGRGAAQPKALRPGQEIEVQGSKRWHCQDGTLNHGAVPSPMKKERVVCDICAVRMSTAPYQ